MACSVRAEVVFRSLSDSGPFGFEVFCLDGIDRGDFFVMSGHDDFFEVSVSGRYITPGGPFAIVFCHGAVIHLSQRRWSLGRMVPVQIRGGRPDSFQ